MKTSDKIITTLLLLALIVGGGLFAYKHFILDRQAAEIADVEGIETKEIWRYHDELDNQDGDEMFNEIITAMENSPAVYFTGVYTEGSGTDVRNGFMSVSQTDKDTFENAIERVSSVDVAQRTIADMELVLDQNYKKITMGMDDFETEALLAWDCFPVVQNGNRMSYKDGNQGLAKFLIDNEVVLKLESIKVDKVCAAEYQGDSPSPPLAFICAIGTAKVTTKSANGDIAEYGLFGNAGETVTLKFASCGDITGDVRLPGTTMWFTLKRIE